MKVTTTNYSDILHYLKDLFTNKKKNNSEFNINVWARQLGYKTPTLLSLMIKGQKKINITFVNKIIYTEALSEEEKQHLLNLLHRHHICD